MRAVAILVAGILAGVACAASGGPPAAAGPCKRLAISRPQTSTPPLTASPSPGYSLPTGAKPVGIAVAGSEIWIGETGLDRVARLRPADGSLTEYQLPVSELGFDLAPAPDGTVWTPEQYRDAIAGISPDGAVSECRLGRGAEPTGVSVAADGTIWVAEGGAGRVARLRKGAATFDTFQMPDPHGKPTELLVSANGVYVTQLAADNVVRIAADGGVTQIALGVEHPQAIGMLEAAGSLWVAEFGADRVARITDGQIAQLDFPAGSKPQSISELGGRLLVTASGTDQLFAVDPATNGVRPVAATGGWPDHLASAGATAWYTEWAGGRVARLG